MPVEAHVRPGETGTQRRKKMSCLKGNGADKEHTPSAGLSRQRTQES